MLNKQIFLLLLYCSIFFDFKYYYSSSLLNFYMKKKNWNFLLRKRLKKKLSTGQGIVYEKTIFSLFIKKKKKLNVFVYGWDIAPWMFIMRKDRVLWMVQFRDGMISNEYDKWILVGWLKKIIGVWDFFLFFFLYKSKDR